MSDQDYETNGTVGCDPGSNDLDTRGLCLLSLDGGGVRGLSTLYILRALMERLNYERRQVKLDRVKPWEVFDLIGGTSTGGLIAIMLGRLRMDVDECINAYTSLMKTVFEKKQGLLRMSLRGMIKSRFSSEALEKAIKDVIESQDLPVDEPFCANSEEEEDSKRCRVFVCSKAKETNYITLLRNYLPRGGPAEPATIWEAALATSAATTFFDPVQIDGRMYVDGAMGVNNPANEVEKEASNIWCEDTGNLRPLVKCFISIGTGDPGINPIADKAWKFLTETLKRVASDTKETEEAVSGRWRGDLNKRYFRFNVHQGLQEVGLAEYSREGLIKAATAGYLDSQETKPRVIACATNLRMKKYPPNRKFCTEQAIHHAREEQNTPQRNKVLTQSEISELMERANANLKKSRDTITHKDLVKAHNDFHRALRAKRDQSPPAAPKELANIYNKLMSTCLRLSYFPHFTPEQRMSYVHDAEKFANRAVEYASLSRNNSRVVQMEFYLAFAKAGEVRLRSEVEQLGKPTPSERDVAVDALSVAWATLRSVENLDISGYNAMAEEIICQLRSQAVR